MFFYSSSLDRFLGVIKLNGSSWSITFKPPNRKTLRLNHLVSDPKRKLICHLPLLFPTSPSSRILESATSLNEVETRPPLKSGPTLGLIDILALEKVSKTACDALLLGLLPLLATLKIPTSLVGLFYEALAYPVCVKALGLLTSSAAAAGPSLRRCLDAPRLFRFSASDGC